MKRIFKAGKAENAVEVLISTMLSNDVSIKKSFAEHSVSKLMLFVLDYL